MYLFIQKNIKKFGIAAVFLMIGLAFIYGNDIMAKIMPSASELQFLYCNSDTIQFEYTGEAIQPEIGDVLFRDVEGNVISMPKDRINVFEYIDNVKPGLMSVEVALDGYSNTVILDDIFYIYPKKVGKAEIVQASGTTVDFKWDKVPGADGYEIYRKSGQEQSFILLAEKSAYDETSYQDTELALNQSYQYMINAYKKIGDHTVYGPFSEAFTYDTPLAEAVLCSVERSAYNALKITWGIVEGAVGYQLFRVESAEGEFHCIADIKDGAVLSYVDDTCECGVEYFYYARTIQNLDEKTIYGKTSNVLSGKSTPDAVLLSGTIINENTGVILNWNKSEGAQGYEVYKSVGYGEEYQLVKKIENADVLTWTDSELSIEIDYSYKVRPYCIVNDNVIAGEDSNEFLKEYIITFDYVPEELSGNIAKITDFVGARYVWGGTSPNGWDCSGFTQWALKNCFGVSIPKVSYEQAAHGEEVSLSDRSAWQAGDILAYSDGTQVCHVALYIGNGQIMHALNEKYDTIIQDVDYYESWESSTRLVTVRRYQ